MVNFQFSTLNFQLEKREVYVAVVAMVDEVRVVGERCFGAMFDDEKSVGVEMIVLEY